MSTAIILRLVFIDLWQFLSQRLISKITLINYLKPRDFRVARPRIILQQHAIYPKVVIIVKFIFAWIKVKLT